MIFKYYIKNKTLESITDLYFGFLSDFDLSSSGDELGMTAENGILYQSGNGIMVGMMPLTSYHGMVSKENGGAKITLTGQQKIEYIKMNGININDSSAADFLTVCSFGPFNLKARDSVEVALAIMAGDNLNSLIAAASNAQRRFNTPTDVPGDHSILPENFELSQNYPNPFNPATTIEYSLASAADINIIVYNILGQEVAELYDGHAEAGNYRVVWNAIDRHGKVVPSGIYFYKMTIGSKSISKKMLLLK
jgi:hypothetical protein